MDGNRSALYNKFKDRMYDIKDFVLNFIVFILFY